MEKNHLPAPPQIRAYRQLSSAIVWSVIIHIIALLAMVLLLAPGLDTTASVASRALWVSENHTLWRLGWLPWQLTAASDIWVSWALLSYCKTLNDKRCLRWAWLGLIAVIIAVIPDQWGEAYFVSHFTSLADATAHDRTLLPEYLEQEAWGLRVTGTWGASAYALMSIGWFMASLSIGGGSRKHRIFAISTTLTVALFFAASALTWHATTYASITDGYPLFSYVFQLNALAFPLLLGVMVLMLCVIASSHHHDFKSPAPYNTYILKLPPQPSLISAPLHYLSSYLPGLRDGIRVILPLPKLRSNTSDVVYLNWLVPADRVRNLLPAPLELAVDSSGNTWLTALIFKHGSIGPAFLGPLRKLLPSPNQCNIRLYLKNDSPAPNSIYFIKTLQSNPLTTLAARLLSDGLPLQLTDSFHYHIDSDLADIALKSDSDITANLSAKLSIAPHSVPHATDPRLAHLIDQSSAISVHPALAKIIESTIHLPIDLNEIKAAELLEFHCPFLQPYICDCPPFAFIVPPLTFEALAEKQLAPL